MDKAKKWAVVLSVLMLLLGIEMLPGYAAGEDVVVRFEAVNVPGEADTLEVGVFVSTANGEAFQSVSAVLAYDNRVLEAIPWMNVVPYDMSQAVDWEHGVTVETKKADEFYSAGAVQYKDGTTTYLCISAEARTPQDCGGGKRIATIRFAYGPGSEEGTSKTKEDVILGTTIGLSENDGVVYGSPSQSTIQYYTGERTYYYNPLTEDESGNVVTEEVDPSLLLSAASGFGTEPVGDGESVAAATDPSQCASIVFYDWDNTLLGSVTVAKGTSAGAQVKAFEDSLKAETFDGGSGFYSSDTGKPLTNKKGYSFEGIWIDYQSAAPTHYGKTTVASTVIPEPEGVSFEKVSGNLIVKAAYNSNEELVASPLTAARYQTAAVGYDRYGATSGNYSVKIQIKRENTAGAGVPRMISPALRVIMTTDATPPIKLYSLITLENKDVETIEIVPTANISVVTCNVIDLSGVSNWTGATARSGNLDVKIGTPESKSGFRFEGNLGFVNSQAAPGGSLNTISAGIITTELGISLVDKNGTVVSIANARTYIQSAWRAKNPDYEEENHPPYRNLTWDELEYAIKNAGSLMPQLN